MPELPEVETTRLGISPSLAGRSIAGVVIRERRLRWLIPEHIEERLTGAVVSRVERRGKYLLLRTGRGTAIAHLGMSGSMRIVAPDANLSLHDHYDIVMDNGAAVRFNDPRRFGCLLWTDDDPANHPLLARLGPEPLGANLSGEYLYSTAKGRRVTIKQHLMNSNIVAGVGNIYANESLFRSGIHPRRAAGRISQKRMDDLVNGVRAVLTEAIRCGGTTLRDFYAADGKPGYFRTKLMVYDRAGMPCQNCGESIRQAMIGQRSSYYCVRCQR